METLFNIANAISGISALVVFFGVFVYLDMNNKKVKFITEAVVTPFAALLALCLAFTIVVGCMQENYQAVILEAVLCILSAATAVQFGKNLKEHVKENREN